jgi:hypothetical protein
MIPHRDIRQANDQLRLLFANRQQDAPPVGCATAIVSPKPAVDPNGVISAQQRVIREAGATVRQCASSWSFLRARHLSIGIVLVPGQRVPDWAADRGTAVLMVGVETLAEIVSDGTSDLLARGRNRL